LSIFFHRPAAPKANEPKFASASALYTVDLFYLHHKEFGIRTLVRNLEFLHHIAADMDQRLRT